MSDTRLLTYVDVRGGLLAKRRELNDGIMILDVLLHYCEACGTCSLPEIMSLDEAIKFIAVQCKEKGIGTLKLGAISN